MIFNIEKQTLDNKFFRKVLQTTSHIQLVVMRLNPLEDIGKETHTENDQFIRVESGTGKFILDGVETEIKENSAFIIPKGSVHNIINTSATEYMHLYTIYSPPHHTDNKIDEIKPAE